MKEKINTYFAILIITITGAGAALLIIHVANTDTPSFIAEGHSSSIR